MASNLIAVPKEVERAGKSFIQRYWMKAEEVAAEIKGKTYGSAVKHLGGDGDLAASISSSWGGSSNSPTSMQAKAMAAYIMGANLDNFYQGDKLKELKMDKLDPAEAARWESTLIAMHAVAQVSLAKQPDEVRVARGISGAQARQVRDSMLALAEAGVPIEDAVVHVQFNPLNSFTSKEAGSNIGFGAAEGIAFDFTVPKEAVLISHRTPAGFTATAPALTGSYAHEQEYVLMVAGPVAAKAENIKGYYGQQIREAFEDVAKNQPERIAAYKEAVAQGLIKPGTMLPTFKLKETLAEMGQSVPASEASAPKLPTPSVTLYIPHGEGASPEVKTLTQALNSEGAAVQAETTAKATTFTIPGDHLGKFVEQFSKTTIFDPTKKSAADLQSYLQDKLETAKKTQAAAGSINKVTVSAADALAYLKAAKDTALTHEELTTKPSLKDVKGLPSAYVQARLEKLGKLPKSGAPPGAAEQQAAPAGVKGASKLTLENAKAVADVPHLAEYIASKAGDPDQQHMKHLLGHVIKGNLDAFARKEMGVTKQKFDSLTEKLKADGILRHNGVKHVIGIDKEAVTEKIKSQPAADKVAHPGYLADIKAVHNGAATVKHPSETHADLAHSHKQLADLLPAGIEKDAHLQASALNDKAYTSTFQEEMTPALTKLSDEAKAASLSAHEMSSGLANLKKQGSAAAPSKDLTAMEKHVLHGALKAADDKAEESYFGKSDNIYGHMDPTSGISKKSLGGVIASLQAKGHLKISGESAGKSGGLVKNAEYHVVDPKAAKEATADIRSKKSAATVMKEKQAKSEPPPTEAPASSSWQDHPEKAAALKAMGYKPNKKDLSPAEEKAITSALAAYDSGKKSGALKDAEDLATITKSAMEIHGAKGSTKWSDAAEEVDQLMQSLQNDPEPTKHTAASAEVAAEFSGKAPQYRKLWLDYAKLGMAKGTPPEKVAEAFEKAQADTKVLMAKAHLKKQKISKYAIKTLLKKQMAKHL